MSGDELGTREREALPQPGRQSGAIAPARDTVRLHYAIAMPQPANHRFYVTLTVSGLSHRPSPASLDLHFPVWTPGSYLVREYARHLQNFTARDPQGQPLPWQKVAKNHWRIACGEQDTVTVQYQIYANELTVRTNHLDHTHGYFNGAALFFRVPGTEATPIVVSVAPPPDWHISTPLPPVPQQSHTFLAADFDTLVDSPFELGTHAVYEFEVLGKPHQLAVWGQGNLAPQRAIADFAKIIETEAALFGGLPYDRYLFLLHLTDQGFGGLEHKFCCSLIYRRFGFREPDKYHRFLQLVAHEFFHLWNVKRLRPKELETFDYEQENYTPSLWFSEGATSYYDLLIPYRAGLYDVQTYCHALSKDLTRFLTTPGRRVQPLSEASFDAWIKLYRQDANSPNTQMSYYLKGQMVCWLLDLRLRQRHQNQRSLDDVLRLLWEQFGPEEQGFTPADLEAAIAQVAGEDWPDFWHLVLHSTAELPLADYLAPFGLEIHAEADTTTPWWGATVKTDHGTDRIKFVEADSPAQLAGIDAGDELLALNGIRVTGDTLSDRLQDYQPGDTVHFTLFHQDELRTCAVTLAPPRPQRYRLQPVPQPTPEQNRLFQGWLGVPLSALPAPH